MEARRSARLLRRAALVELAPGQQPALPAGEPLPAAFDEAAVCELKRHRYPWAPLLLPAQGAVEAPCPVEPFFVASRTSRPTGCGGGLRRWRNARPACLRR